MSKCIGYAILVYACSNVAGIGFYLVQSIAHSHTCAGSTQHSHVIAAIAECHGLAYVNIHVVGNGTYAVSLVGCSRCYVAERRIPTRRYAARQ